MELASITTYEQLSKIMAILQAEFPEYMFYSSRNLGPCFAGQLSDAKRNQTYDKLLMVGTDKSATPVARLKRADLGYLLIREEEKFDDKIEEIKERLFAIARANRTNHKIK